MTRSQLTTAIESGLPPVAGIILIVAAGGGFKQVLVDSGIGTLLARWAEGAHCRIGGCRGDEELCGPVGAGEAPARGSTASRFASLL